MKKFLSIILALVFCISSLSMYAYAVPRTTYDSYEVAQAKIDDALKEKLETMEDDEYVKVVVWLKDYGDEPLYALLSERYGEEITANNEDFIVDRRIEEKKAQVKGLVLEDVEDIREKAQISDIVTDEEIERYISNGMTIDELIEVSERNEYLHNYRQARQDTIQASNARFSEAIDEDECTYIWVSELLPMAVVETTKSYLEAISTLQIISGLSLYIDMDYSLLTSENESNDSDETTTFGISMMMYGLEERTAEIEKEDLEKFYSEGNTVPTPEFTDKFNYTLKEKGFSQEDLTDEKLNQFLEDNGLSQYLTIDELKKLYKCDNTIKYSLDLYRYYTLNHLKICAKNKAYNELINAFYDTYLANDDFEITCVSSGCYIITCSKSYIPYFDDLASQKKIVYDKNWEEHLILRNFVAEPVDSGIRNPLDDYTVTVNFIFNGDNSDYYFPTNDFFINRTSLLEDGTLNISLTCKKKYLEYLDELVSNNVINQLNEETDEDGNVILSFSKENVPYMCLPKYDINTGKIDFPSVPVPVETNLISDDSTSNTTRSYYYMYPHNSLNKTGQGVKAGVLEVKMRNGNCGYNQSSVYLSQKTITIPDGIVLPSLYSSHATNVLSILGGDNDGTYQGIAPSSDLYFADLSWFYDSNNYYQLENAIMFFGDNDVSVLNMSFGRYDIFNYYDYDKYIDIWSEYYKMICVVAAGNTNSGHPYQNNIVTSPGKAFNSITVGNASNTLTESKYTLRNSSLYKEIYSSLPNKPDITAFGTDIYMGSYLGSGTSYAAPMVTGTIACMLEANSRLIGKPDAVKAILMATADQDAIYVDEYNTIKVTPVSNDSTVVDVEGTIRDKSGAGLLNITSAIDTAMHSTEVYRFSYNPMMPAAYHTDFETPEMYFSSTSEVEATLVFPKTTTQPESIPYGTNFDIEVVDSNNVVVAYTEDLVNNAEALKCTFNTSGWYRFRVHCESVDDYETTNPAYATLVITCGCQDSKLEISNCNPASHTVSCSTCNISFSEKHTDLQTINKQFQGYSINYHMYYKFNTLSDKDTDLLNFDCFHFTSEVTNSIQGYTIDVYLDDTIPAGSTSSTKTYRYVWVVVVEPNNSPGNYFIDVHQFTVTQNYLTGTCSLQLY